MCAVETVLQVTLQGRGKHTGYSGFDQCFRVLLTANCQVHPQNCSKLTDLLFNGKVHKNSVSHLWFSEIQSTS